MHKHFHHIDLFQVTIFHPWRQILFLMKHYHVSVLCIKLLIVLRRLQFDGLINYVIIIMNKKTFVQESDRNFN